MIYRSPHLNSRVSSFDLLIFGKIFLQERWTLLFFFFKFFKDCSRIKGLPRAAIFNVRNKMLSLDVNST